MGAVIRAGGVRIYAAAVVNLPVPMDPGRKTDLKRTNT